MRRPRATRFLASTLWLVACGGDDKNTSDAADGAPVDVDAATACTHTDFTPDTEGVERDDELGVFFYTATTGTAPNIERLTFDFYFPFGATDGPQEVTFTGENLKDCHTCLVARRECEAARCSDGRAFLVQEGTASITAMGAAGTTFEGTLSNAVFAEVTISVADLETTLVPNGETWCIDSLALSAPISAPQ